MKIKPNMNIEQEIEEILDAYSIYEYFDQDPKRGGITLEDAIKKVLALLAKEKKAYGEWLIGEDDVVLRGDYGLTQQDHYEKVKEETELINDFRAELRLKNGESYE